MIDLNLETAERVARAAIAKAKSMGKPMTVSIVDESGRLVLCLKGDGTGFLTTETSRAKAVAAAAFRGATRDFVEMAKTNPFWSSLPALTRGEVLPTGGAVPIKLNGRVIGAIGCGGGTPEEDHECAVAGAAAA